jgi:Zn/Cd-binding protein ZinT
MSLNARIVSLSSEVASMNTKDAVKAVFGEIHHDPKSGDSAMNCFLSCWSYQNNRNTEGWKFVVDKKNGKKYTIAEILDYTKSEDHRIVQILKNEDTMTFLEIKAGDIHKDVYVIIETHCVVMGFDLSVVFNCQKNYEEVEVGIWEEFTGWVKKDVLGDKKENESLKWWEKLAKQHTENFNKTYGTDLKIIKPSEPKIIDRLLVQQKENFEGMEYGKKLKALKDSIIDDDKDKTFFENLKARQVKNFEEMNYPERFSKLVDTVIGTEETPLFKQHEKNFKELWVEKLKVFGVNEKNEITIAETLRQQQENFMSSYGGIALNRCFGSIQETTFDKAINALEDFENMPYNEREAHFDKLSKIVDSSLALKEEFLLERQIKEDLEKEKADLELALAESKKMYEDIVVPETETVCIEGEAIKVCTENVPEAFKGTKEFKKISKIFVGKCGDVYVWVRPDLIDHFYTHFVSFENEKISCQNRLCEESLKDIKPYTFYTCMRTKNSYAYNEDRQKFLNLIESKANDKFYNSVLHPVTEHISLY